MVQALPKFLGNRLNQTRVVGVEGEPPDHWTATTF